MSRWRDAPDNHRSSGSIATEIQAQIVVLARSTRSSHPLLTFQRISQPLTIGLILVDIGALLHRHLAECNRKAVPAIDGHNQQRQVCNLGIGKIWFDRLPCCIWHMLL